MIDLVFKPIDENIGFGEVVEKKPKAKSKKVNDGLTAEQRRIKKAIEHINTYMETGELHARGELKLITNDLEYIAYLDAIKKNGVVAIDTETTGLDVFNIRVCGLCLYTPGMPSVYIPTYHTDIYGNVDSRCMDEQFVANRLKELLETGEIKTIYHNAKYDMKVLKHIWGIDTRKSNVYWDTMLGAYILNENEEKGLKPLHNKYIMQGTDTGKDFSDYFGKTPFNYVPLDVAKIYAANDTIKTYELYEFQNRFLNPNHKREDFKKLYNVFRNIEMPLLNMLVDIELRGWKIDLTKTEPLGKEYEEEIAKYKALIDEEVMSVKNKILKNETIMRLTKGDITKLNFSSSQQAKAFFYEVLKLKVPNKKKGKSCDKEALEFWVAEYDLNIAKYLLRYRELNKLYSTYINKLPSVLNKQTMKIHSSFNQSSTDTGRFSSSDPITKVNLQNIPTSDARIRQLFIADEGKLLIGGDFS